jgi:hypothetical protein
MSTCQKFLYLFDMLVKLNTILPYNFVNFRSHSSFRSNALLPLTPLPPSFLYSSYRLMTHQQGTNDFTVQMLLYSRFVFLYFVPAAPRDYSSCMWNHLSSIADKLLLPWVVGASSFLDMCIIRLNADPKK